MKKTFLRARLVAVLLTLVSLPALSQQVTSIVWTPENLANGSPCLFVVKVHNASAVSGKWQGHDLSFFRAQNSWYALAGIDIEVPQAATRLQLS
jgi:hypothetical protein